MILITCLVLVAPCFSFQMDYLFIGIYDTNNENSSFIVLGYINGELFTHYDSDTSQMVPVASWANKLKTDYPNHWNQTTEVAKLANNDFIEEAKKKNHTRGDGTYVLQKVHSCLLDVNGDVYEQHKRKHHEVNKASFDLSNAEWETRNNTTIEKKTFESNSRVKQFLDMECTSWLQIYLKYSKESLTKKIPPHVQVSVIDLGNHREKLVCRADGFYPSNAKLSWTKNDQDMWLKATSSNALPNSDGTFHRWIEITVDSSTSSYYRCSVNHPGLQEPLIIGISGTTTYEISTSRSHQGFIISLFVIFLLLGFIYIMWNMKREQCMAIIEWCARGTRLYYQGLELDLDTTTYPY